uniref:Uncharacterized protein n=1 Tax=Myotis myotis TaxID=51298 RepID=A0A7J7YEC1_MYOMY|nr:hypothetical protein mMyoMyo1_013676 [Myotis myotis]
MKVAADFSILESQKEFVCQYCQHHEEEPRLPMLTSACLAWDRYAEHVLGHPITPTSARPKDVPIALYSSQGEIVQVMEQSDLTSNDAAVDTLFGDKKGKEMRLHESASSDGYLAHILRHMAKDLFNEDVGVLTYGTLRNKDFQEVTLQRDEEVLLCFEAAYGFETSRSGLEAVEGQVPLPLCGDPTTS